MDLTVRKLAEAVRGVTDAVNIAYGAGTQPNPDIMGAYTSQSIAIGATILAAGSTLYLKFKVGDRTVTAFPTTFTTTTIGSTLVNFTRVFSGRYSIPAGGADINDHIAGVIQTLVPLNWVHDVSGNLVYYDPSVQVVEGVSNTASVYEADLLESADEVTFTVRVQGLNLSYNAATSGSQQYNYRHIRIAPGSGLYIRIRETANGVETIDLKVQLHQYPYGV